MLSIIVCSRYKNPEKLFSENLKNTVGIDFEIVHIDNSDGKYSIFSAYNEGIKKSKYSNLCFVHEDVLFHTQNWGSIIVNHLDTINSGLIGIAGGNLVCKIPSGWFALDEFINILQHETEKNTLIHIEKPLENNKEPRMAVAIDGVFICAKKSLFDSIKFDESFTGFHGYDIDISLQSHQRNFNNFVIYDVLLEHRSYGNMNKDYYLQMMKIHEKWDKYLPVFSRDYPIENQQKIIPSIHKKRLKKLRKYFIRAHFSINETASMINLYAQKIAIKKFDSLTFATRIKLYYILASSKLRNKMK